MERAFSPNGILEWLRYSEILFIHGITDVASNGNSTAAVHEY